MAAEMMTARDIPIAEQHEFLDLAKEFKWTELKRRIITCPALVNVRPAMRWSALHQASYSGDVDAVRFLLNCNAAIDAQSAQGQTPLDVAKGGAVKSMLTEFASSGKVPTPLRTSQGVAKGAMAIKDKSTKAKVMKAKAMQAVKKTIAKGRRAKALVYQGKFKKTSAGLTKDCLTKSKAGKIVSKRMQAHGKKSYCNIQSWVQAFVKARAELGINGFVAVKKGSALYVKTMDIYKSSE
jgi:hypothetical protein